MEGMSRVKILFVCYGNTCRSPMAEAVFKNLLKEQNLEDEFEVDSAGTSLLLKKFICLNFHFLLQ